MLLTQSRQPTRFRVTCSSRSAITMAAMILVLLPMASCAPTGGDQQENTYTIAVTITPPDGGSVALDPAQGPYAAGQQVTLTATPAAGFQFDRWQGGATGTTNPVQVTVNDNLQIEAVFVATGGGGGGGGGGTVEPKVSRLAKVLPATVNIQTNAAGQLELSGADVPALLPGHVITRANADGSGLLARVKSVTSQDGKLVLTTTPAGLTDLFEQVHISLDAQSLMAQGKGLPARRVRSQKALFDFDIVENEDGTKALQLATGDIGLELEDGFKVTLKDFTFKFTPVLTLEATLSGFSVDYFKLEASGNVDVNLDIEVESSVITGLLKKEIDVAEVDFLTGAIPAGPVLIPYVCTLKITAGVEGKAGDVGTASAGVGLTTGLKAGAEYLDGAWKPIGDFTFDVTPHPPSIGFGPLEVQVYLKPEISIKFFDVVGPALSFKDYFKLLTDVRAEDADLGIELRKGSAIDVAIKMDVFDIYKLGYEKTLWDSSYVMLARMAFRTDPLNHGTITPDPQEFFSGTGLYWYINPVTVHTLPTDGFETVGYRVRHLCDDKSVFVPGYTLQDEPVNASKLITAVILPIDPSKNADGTTATATGPCTITTEVFPPEASTITIYPNKTGYWSGEKVVCRAKPEYGFKFHHWEGSLEGTDNVVEFVVPHGNATIRAVFESTVPRDLHVPQGYGTIQAAIDAATYGDQVRLDVGTYSGDGNRDLDFHGRHMTLIGQSAEITIIDLGGSEAEPHRLADIRQVEGEVQLLSLTVRNGYAPSGSPNYSGGAVMTSEKSSLYVAFCSFVNCGATYGGGAIWFGSPRSDYQSRLQITESRFENCAGGALYLDEGPGPSSVSVDHCTFTGNTGSAIVCSFFNGTVDLTDNTFTSNQPHAVNSGRITPLAQILRCTFTGNTGDSAIDCADTTLIQSCTFTGNRGDNAGAAIRTSMNAPTGTVTIEDCQFTNNSAEEAGAVCLQEKATMRRCQFTGNHATTSDGGAASISGHASNCTFHDNIAHDLGGAVVISTGGVVDNSEFINNSSSELWGGAVRLSDGVLSGSYVGNNQAKMGGGIFSSGGTIHNCTVTGNSTTERHSGGGIDASHTDILSCIVTDNHVIGNGGGLAVFDHSLVSGCTVYGNTADENGGGIYGIEFTITDSSVTSNQAAEGGGIWSGSAMAESTINGNMDVSNNNPDNCHAESGDVCAGY